MSKLLKAIDTVRYFLACLFFMVPLGWPIAAALMPPNREEKP